MRSYSSELRRGVSAGALFALAIVSLAGASHAAAGAKDQPASAQAAQPARSTSAPSTSVVINLIRMLVQEGVLTKDKADALIRQAEDEAAAAARGQVAGAAPGAVASAGSSGSVRVPYVPEIVKKQIRDEVKQEVMQQARAENWAAPNQIAEWTKRFKISGDFRLRYEWNLFDKRNVEPFVNYATLNSGNPYDLNNQLNAPLPVLDTTSDRQRMRERFRLGIDAEIDDGFSAGLRLATGNTTNPVTTNQTLGTTLNKDNFLLDRAYLRYEPGPWAVFWAGRFQNPWFYTDLIWKQDDVNFDGVAAQFQTDAGDGIRPFLTVGVFPIENTPFNFPDNALDKQPSRDKWLYAGQVGTEWRPDHDFDLKLGLAYYQYQDVEGETSSLCTATTSSIPCSTDNSRPGFIQQGNTLFAIRNLGGFAATTNAPPQFQYYGLASEFHELDLTGRFDYAAYDPVHLIVDLDFERNLAFDRAQIIARSPVNNLGATASGSPGPWNGGGDAFQARLTIGYPELRRRWEWNIVAAYKYLESDSLLDAFTDSDFHLGGTNAKGYIFGGGLGVARGVDLSARWYSAREITGFPYSVDVVQVDLNGRF